MSGTTLHLHGGQDRPGRPRPHAAAGGGCAEQQPHGARLVGDHQRPRRQLARAPLQSLAWLRLADPQAALDAAPVEGAQGDARLDDRDREGVVEQAAADESAVLHALQGDRLHGSLLLVRVESDVAVEHPVGPGDRLVPQVDRLRAREPVRQLRQALLQTAWSAARPPLYQQVAQGEAGELLTQLGRDPARLWSRSLAHQRAAAARARDSRSSRWTFAVICASESSPIFSKSRIPPG